MIDPTMASHRANPVQQSCSGTAWLGSDPPEFGLVMLEPSRVSKFKPGISINWIDYLSSSRSMTCSIGKHQFRWYLVPLTFGQDHIECCLPGVLLTYEFLDFFSIIYDYNSLPSISGFSSSLEYPSASWENREKYYHDELLGKQPP